MDKCKYCNPKSYISIIVDDEDGNAIPFERVDCYQYDSTMITLRIKDGSSILTDRDLAHLRFLINDAIKYGVTTSIAREYIELLDKLDKINNKKTS